MIAIVSRTGHLLWRHWPALMAWFLAGTIGNRLLLELASQVGVRTALGGVLLLPLAALSLLVAYVAMLLVLREDMPGLTSLAPLPETAAARRRAFLDAVLGGILPFVAFYAAWGFLREDVVTYTNRAFEIHQYLGLEAVGDEREYDLAGTVSDIGIDAVTIGIVVVAFGGRWLYSRYKKGLPVALGVIAVYLEALWVYLTAYVIGDLLAGVTAWVERRQAMVWLADLREGLTGVFAPIGFLWDGVEWLLGEVGGLILLPLAWLTIAGVIYGQAVVAQAPALSGERFDRVRARYGTIPQRVRKRLSDLWLGIVAKFRPIGRALVLMWRAGPILIGGYVLLFTVIELAEQWLLIGGSRLIGPHDRNFWTPGWFALFTVVALIVEPIRMSLVAGAYDRTLVQLTAPAAATATTADPAEPSVDPEEVEIERALGVDRGELDHEGTVGIPGEQHGGDEVVRDDRL